MKKGFVPVFLLIFVVLSLGIGYFFVKGRNKSPVDTGFFTYNECVKAGFPIVETYPRQCKTKDGKTFIEETKSPVNTDNWQRITVADLGFSYKCPPTWTCRRYDEGMVNISANSKSIDFSIVEINKDNLDHPSYKRPIDWLNDLRAKKPLAVKVFPETIKPVPGTDDLKYPFYKDIVLEKIREKTLGENTVVVAETINNNIPLDTFLLIPAGQNVIRISSHPIYVYTDPLAEAVVSTIEVINK